MRERLSEGTKVRRGMSYSINNSSFAVESRALNSILSKAFGRLLRNEVEIAIPCLSKPGLPQYPGKLHHKTEVCR